MVPEGTDDGTPVEGVRDRLADLVRVAAIVVVVVGHWTAVVVLVGDDGIEVTNLFVVAPWTRWLTWLFQVVPLFFLAGGLANATSWDKAVARGEDWWSWVQRRAARLLAPLAPLAVAWVPAALALAYWDGDAAGQATRAAFAPLWFLVVYLVVIAATPWTLKAHRRAGLGALVVFVVLAAAVDAAARHVVAGVALANLAIVWAGIHQAGYFWAEGRLPRGRVVGMAVAGVALAATVALVAWAGYEVSMTTVGGGVPNNAAPPTVALLMLAAVQAGLLAAARRPADGLMGRDRVRRAVAQVGTVVLPVYVWHVTALIVTVGLVHASGLWRPLELDAVWLAARPAFLVVCGVVLAGLVAAARAVTPEPSGMRPRRARVALGLAGSIVGIAWINQVGYDVTAPATSAAGFVVLLSGLWAVGALARRDRSARPAS